MNKPWYQQFITKYLPWALAMVFLVSSLLDTIKKSITLINPTTTYLATAIVLIVYIASQVAMLIRPIEWVTDDGNRIRIRSLGLRPLFVIMGFILVLWIPRFRNQAPEVPDAESSDATVTLQVVTGRDGTNNNPILLLHRVSTTNPIELLLDNPGDLAPGQTDIYTFSIQASFCDISSYELIKPASPGDEDPWNIQEVYLSINGKVVFFEKKAYLFNPVTSKSSPINGDWTGSSRYKTMCPEFLNDVPVPSTPNISQNSSLTLQIVTGNDGTNDNPVLSLHRISTTEPIELLLDNPGDLARGQTDIYTFSIPTGFCDIRGYSMIKPAGPAGDDPWQIQEVSLSINNKLVFLDRALSSFNPVTSTSFPLNGGW